MRSKGKTRRASRRMVKADGDDRVDLLRGGRLVSTLTGALGLSVRETRITAILGYLIAQNPERFLGLFGFPGTAVHVGIETHHEEGRSDILIETTRGTGIVEAKIDATDPREQSRRYPAGWVALLGKRRKSGTQGSRLRYVHWDDVVEVLNRLRRTGSAMTRLLSADLTRYLEENNVAKQRESVEIYAREINEPVTLALFLKARLYGCNYTAGSRLGEAMYFAPHFGQRIATDHPGVTTGISYVARVESVQVASKWRELMDLLVSERGRTWCRQHKSELDQLHRHWKWPKERFFLLLGEPRLAFNPPVRKERLQKGSGFLSKRFLSFDELFKAWKA